MNLHLINAVTMLREPKARMISAFLYGIHNAGDGGDCIHIHAYHDDDDDDDDDEYDEYDEDDDDDDDDDDDGDDGLKCVWEVYTRSVCVIYIMIYYDSYMYYDIYQSLS